jgi:transposase-like protein
MTQRGCRTRSVLATTYSPLNALQCEPQIIVTDKLRSYGVANRYLRRGVEHQQSRYLNNRAENSHRPTRRRASRCNGSDRSSRPRASSPLTHSSMVTSIHAGITRQPLHIAGSGPVHLMSGSRSIRMRAREPS